MAVIFCILAGDGQAAHKGKGLDVTFGRRSRFVGLDHVGDLVLGVVAGLHVPEA